MTRVMQEQAEESTRATPRPPEPAPLVSGSMEWASALGNHAVARLARQVAPDAEEAAPEAAEAAAAEQEEAGTEEAVAATIDELPEDELPE